MTMARRRLFLVGLVAAAALVAGRAYADSRAMQQDALRRAVENGEARPLSEIMAEARGKVPGEIVGVKVEYEHSRWVYEFRVIDGKGRLIEVYVDAKTGDIERIKEK